MKIDMGHVKDGKSGEWEIIEFEVADKELSQIISLFKTGRAVPAGKYKRLMRGRTCIMSNTPDEIRDFMHFVREAKGNVLINGLGLGVVLTAILNKKEVTKVTVVEQSEDVIMMVAPCFNDERLTIVHADAYTYQIPKGEKYNAVWHDIWDDICGDNTEEMAKLHRKYARKTEWQDSWAKSLCQEANRKWKREKARYAW